MEEEYPFFTNQFLSLGDPHDTRLTTFAFVSWEGELRFNINCETFEQLTDEQRVFVCMHETMHVVLNHDRYFSEYTNRKKLNIAQDIIINDYLVSRGIPKLEGVHYGEETIGEDSNGLTVREVYDMLPDDIGQSSFILMFGGDGESCGHDAGESDDSEPIPDSVIQEIKGKGDLKQIEDAFNDNMGQDPSLRGHGSSSSQKMEQWQEENNMKLKWAEFIKKIDPDVFGNDGYIGRRTHTFQRLNRKVAYAAPRVVLPVYRDSRLDDNEDGKKKPVIVLAVDTSGSIGADTRARFLRCAKSIPQDRIDVMACTFTTSYVPVDLSKKTLDWRSGGTDFDCIEDFIQDKVVPVLDKYPDAVVVFTDGDAWLKRPNALKNLDKWHWLLQNESDMRRAYVGRDVANNSGTWDLLSKYAK